MKNTWQKRNLINKVITRDYLKTIALTKILPTFWRKTFFFFSLKFRRSAIIYRIDVSITNGKNIAFQIRHACQNRQSTSASIIGRRKFENYCSVKINASTTRRYKRNITDKLARCSNIGCDLLAYIRLTSVEVK